MHPSPHLDASIIRRSADVRGRSKDENVVRNRSGEVGGGPDQCKMISYIVTTTVDVSEGGAAGPLRVCLRGWGEPCGLAPRLRTNDPFGVGKMSRHLRDVLSSSAKMTCHLRRYPRMLLSIGPSRLVGTRPHTASRPLEASRPSRLLFFLAHALRIAPAGTFYVRL